MAIKANIQSRPKKALTSIPCDWAPQPPPFVPPPPRSKKDVQADVFQTIREFTSQNYDFLPDAFIVAVLALPI